jgi:hypothetical protein
MLLLGQELIGFTSLN